MSRFPDSGATSLLAAKRYRDGDHRLFHRDAGYLEGRRVRKSRETRAMANRTGLGRALIAQQWAATEFETLGRLWVARIPVRYPVQLAGTELLMELIGTDGAPRRGRHRHHRARLALGSKHRRAVRPRCHRVHPR